MDKKETQTQKTIDPVNAQMTSGPGITMIDKLDYNSMSTNIITWKAQGVPQ